MKCFVNVLLILLILRESAAKESNSVHKKNVQSQKRDLAITIKSIISKLLVKYPIIATISTTAVAMASKLLLHTKPIALALGSIYSSAFILGLIFPSLNNYLGTPTTTFRAIRDYVGNGLNSYFRFDGVNRIVQVLDFTDTTFEYVGVSEIECREKAACELGHYMAKQYPSAATVMRLMGDEAPTKYGHAFLKGTSLIDCADEYNNCLYSPSERYFT